MNKKNEIEELIKEAAIESTVKNSSIGRSIELPTGIPYLVGALLVISLIYNLPHFSSNTLQPTTEALDSGKRVGLLTIAENINAYRREHGSLPETTPSALGSVLNIKYTVLGENHYELSMPTLDGVLVLNHMGSSEEIHIDKNKT